MNKKAIDSLLEAKRQIDDTITQLIRENEAGGKGIVSALSKCEYMLLGSCIIFPQGFLDWCLSRGFLLFEHEMLDFITWADKMGYIRRKEDNLFIVSSMIERWNSVNSLKVMPEIVEAFALYKKHVG